MHGKGYGMPSSHSQFVSFFSLSLTLFLLLRHHPTNPPHPPSHSPLYPSYPQSTLLERSLLSLASLICAAAVATSRIYLSYHTPKQVLVGVAAGAVFAVFWFAVCTWARSTGWIGWGLESRVARMVRMRDLIVTEDLQDAGWGRWEARRGLATVGVGSGSGNGSGLDGGKVGRGKGKKKD